MKRYIKMFKERINNFSIKKINIILFFLMFHLILFTILFQSTYFSKLFIIFTALILSIIFLVFNYYYTKEFEKSKEEIKKILNTNNSTLLWRNSLYLENKNTNSLFNSLILNKNILKKDYSDLENILHKFTSEYFLKEIFKKGIDRLELGISMKKYVHVMFLDIIWFTTITEKTAPDRALLLLNIYFDWIVEIINKYWGFVDKFLWDWMLVIFPFRSSDNVLEASVEIQKYMKNFTISDIWKNISVWIWINSWVVIMWTIWSKNRMEVTIIWDTVNTTSRIENLTRKNKEKIIISETTFKLAKNKEKFKINYLGEKILKWKKVKKKIYGVSELET